MSVNKVLLIGRLGRDPESRQLTSGAFLSNFPVATSERRKNASGDSVEHTEWHNIVAFGKIAELCSKYLQKGREVFIEGRLQTRKWQDKAGADRFSTEVVATSVEFLGPKPESAAGPAENHKVTTRPAESVTADGVSEFLDDDLPL